MLQYKYATFMLTTQGNYIGYNCFLVDNNKEVCNKDNVTKFC